MDRFKALQPEAQDEFRVALVAYVHLYSFMSQILPFTDPDLEKLYSFARFLELRLPLDPRKAPLKLDEETALAYYRLERTSNEVSIPLASVVEHAKSDEQVKKWAHANALDGFSLAMKAREGAQFGSLFGRQSLGRQHRHERHETGAPGECGRFDRSRGRHRGGTIPRRRSARPLRCEGPGHFDPTGRPHRSSSKTAFTWPFLTARSRAAWSFSFWSA